jgi:hypothetical protein
MPSRPLSEILEGFVNDPSTVFFVLLGLLALVGGALAVYVVQNRRMRRALELQSARARERAMARLRPAPRERAIIARLVRLVSDPSTRGHLVLTNQNTFNLCASRLVAARGATDEEIAALRVRLGFVRSASEKAVHSTAILPRGLRLFVVQRETKRFYATVSETGSEAIVAHIEDPNVVAPGPGTELRCYFNVRNGTFHFTTVVQSVDGRVVRLAHSEKIERTQRRKYYRTHTSMPARVGVAGSSDALAATVMLDLSGGGASLENPALRFNEGDDVQIQFTTPDGAEYKLVAEVRRLSRGGRVMHLLFGPMSEGIRDRLVALVLSLRRPRSPIPPPAAGQPVPRP